MNNSVFNEATRLHNVKFSPVRQVMENMRKYVNAGKDVIPFQIGEPDFYAPKAVVEATKKAMDENWMHYAPNRGRLDVRTSISKLCEEKGLHYDPETEILMTCGGAEALFDAITAFVNPDDEVIVFTPAFMNYGNDINYCNAKMVELPLRKEDGFQINPALFEEKITSKTKMVVLNNPSNPTGVVFNPEILAEVAKICVKHNLIVLDDEMYDEICFDGLKCISIATFPGMKERTIVCNGFSKAYAMTGWRVGYLCAPADCITTMLKVHQYATTCIATFIQKGLAEAMLTPEARADKANMIATFQKKRNLLMSCIDKIPELSYIKPQGAFYLLLDVSGTGLTGTEFANQLLDKKYVAVVPGVGFCSTAVNFVRISYATSERNIEEGVRRIGEFIKELKK